MAEIKLSVLVCGLYERLPVDGYSSAGHAVTDLLFQAADKPVEVLTLYDSATMSVGRKRNILLSIAQGEWFAFVDDDDEVAPDYVSVLLKAIDSAGEAGVIVFGQTCIHADTGEVEHCEYGLEYEYRKDGDQWRGKPAHTMCWRTDLVQDVEFPEGNFGEDTGWVAKACERVKVEHRLGKVLYTYRFNPKTSRTRG